MFVHDIFVVHSFVLFTSFVIYPLLGTNVSYLNIPPYKHVYEPLLLVRLVFDIFVILFCQPPNVL